MNFDCFLAMSFSYWLCSPSLDGSSRVHKLLSSNDILYLSWDIIVKKNRQKLQTFSKILRFRPSSGIPGRIQMDMLETKIFSLAEELKGCKTLVEKLQVLDGCFPGGDFGSQEEALVVKSLMAIGQQERIFRGDAADRRQELIQELTAIEKFYATIGGIVGYQARMLQLLSSEPSQNCPKKADYLPAVGVDISQEHKIKSQILQGLHHLPSMAEIYPLGGAADRLRLHDERTGKPLPAACLPFLGKTLLEGMIADLQAKEYLYYKVLGEQITTPVAMMTSQEKNNHAHILSICEEAEWFGRPQESFRFFCQPAVPTVNKNGEWCLQGPMQLFLKPGGHGVIWRLARDEGVFDWFFSLGRKKGLVRQINNPVAGTDYGILAFTGMGCAEDKVFGFASCPRDPKAAEGINVVIAMQKESGPEYVLTNIEYCDLKRFGIKDQPKFPTNTNILFVDFQAILGAVTECPIPGILVNLKKLTYRTESGHKKEEEIARLESTMQNIADFFPAQQKEELKSYLTYNIRRKTISTAKREFTLGASLLETPEGCFLDVLQNSRDVLLQCGIEVPEVNDPAHFFEHGPAFIFLYNPALGPLYSIIAQKIRGGRLAQGSELQLDIAEIDIENLDLNGSLRIHADAVLGHLEKGVLTYSERCGRVILKNVCIDNQGIDLEMPNVYWKNEIARTETCQILLRGMSEFVAENVTLKGDHFIEVDDGYRVTAVEKEGQIIFEKTPITTPSWHWKYRVSAGDANPVFSVYHEKF
jgi:hypothetical protein